MKKLLLPCLIAAAAALPVFIWQQSQAQSAPTVISETADSDVRAAQSDTDELQAVIDKVYPAFVRINGGSGVCISPDGYVLTNHHVAPEATKKYRSGTRLVKVSVNMPGRAAPYTALPVAADPRGDIVLLKIQLEEGETVPFAPLADSDLVQTGDICVAVGNPFLLGSESNEPSVSTGVVSAVGRHQSGYTDVFQIDAAVNPGNSGGPTFNLQGEVIGINGRILTAHGGRYNTGLGYAIPANQIARFLPTMKSEWGGSLVVRHGLVSGLAMKHDARRQGCEVLDVREDSTAARAGFKPGDIVTYIDKYPVRGVSGFYGKLCTWPQGATVDFTVTRGEESKKLSARLEVPVLFNQSLPWPFATDRDLIRDRNYEPDFESEFIFQAVPVRVRQAQAMDMGFMSEPGADVLVGIASMPILDVEPDKKGLRVDSVSEGSSADGKLQVGDVITHVGERPVFYQSDIRDCLLGYAAGDKMKLKVLRGGAPQEVEITLKRR
ncbi:MAG: trypsin-like peptidase domain-containing protein [Planctomycetes bacterium]|nr:trypsin-like peptidase domain-containing protein [Planctomycetota bacterium]